jgi:hypothetical protein
MTKEAYRPAAAATLCTALGVFGMVMSSAAARPGDPPITPETLTPDQAEEKCREAEENLAVVEGHRELNEDFAQMRESAREACVEREIESNEREIEHVSGG